MDPNIKTKFASIYSKCLKEQQTVEDISDLIVIIRENAKYISDCAKKLLLQIPLYVLENQVALKKSNSVWASENREYFAGNYSQEPIHSRFSSENFGLDIMVDCLKDIMSDSQLLNSDFNLRNPEVTLQDDVILKQHSNFKESGKIFAHIIEKAFDC